ncbi:DUF4114 domain-containing protein [Myxococcus faecalis]|uniref:DUF4114 domain-containing protein n=1 Tax=Myxococcus faecalis TaxID=3115646 RepID=UPI003CFAE987
MKALHRALSTLLLLATPAALADDGLAQLCKDNLAQDKQPGFGNAENDLGQMTFPKELKLIPTGRSGDADIQLLPPEKLNPEKIVFPYDQRVTISYVFESAGASHALGYMYLDQAAKYLNAAGDLVDTNGNGVLDLHEDLFNIAPQSGPKKRDFIGDPADRRCGDKTFTSDGEEYTEPAISMKATCAKTWRRVTGNNGLADARPGGGSTHIDTDIVGTSQSSGTAAADDYSDRGLFPRIPNLLEPADDKNGGKGIGQMVFLLADDDSDKTTFLSMTPVKDMSDDYDAVPDYNVSTYDNRGVPLPAPDSADKIDLGDRTVDLGTIQGNREIVFFLIVYYSSNHGPNEGTVYPCLKQDSDGKCLLHLQTPINVFFSKSAWNLDQNSSSAALVAERNIGCPYQDSCSADNPQGTASNQCVVSGTSNTKLCGWLDDDTLFRLKNEATYGNLVMPKEAATINRPGGVRNAMPHVIVGAPSTDPFRWILGFEDLPGGGDRDFNDVVFVINKVNGGTFRSASLSNDIDLSDAEDFVITKVRFTRYDDVAPAAAHMCSTPPCWTEETPGACSVPGRAPPTITYSVAVDCHTYEFEGGVYVKKPNPNRTWIPVQFDTGNPNVKELDLLEMGFTGSQLCWKVDITSPDDRCVPVVDNVNVGYQAVRSGSYSRSSPSTVGNAILWGVNETPGSAWGKNWPGVGMPEASTRLYDGRKDYSLRGRLYFRSLYDPENTNLTNVVERWDGGRVMAMTLRNEDPLNRTIYTMKPDQSRITLKDDMDNANSVAFPDSLCNQIDAGKRVFDMNSDGKCGTPTMAPAARITEGFNDRNVFREWLYGWEDHQLPGATNVKRPWAMGGINLSTVAVAVPPYLDNWAMNALPAERDVYRRNFMSKLSERPTVAYVGTMTGVLHAFDSGAFRLNGKDECSDDIMLRGYFLHSGATCAKPIAPRQYGTGKELFAYMPGGLLKDYVYHYVKYAGSGTKPKPTMDASPTLANVDFGGLGEAWTPATATTALQRPLKGARTTLVSATGKGSPIIFALDVTHPSTDPASTRADYPMPLWEYNLKNDALLDAFTDEADDDDDVLLPDQGGSRHPASVTRIQWGASDTTGTWAAIIGTDFKPTAGRAGTLYLLDMKTGKPLQRGTGKGAHAGVITLDEGSGIAGATAMLDLNRDGHYDVMYVPTTAGSVYRINLDSVDSTRTYGRQVRTCRVASAPVAASTHVDAASNPAGTAHFQQIHSNLAVKVLRDTAKPVVRIYFGTGDNPDEIGDGPPNKEDYRYHLMAFEDPNPDGSKPCALLDPLWVQPLDPGQAVWGGVSLSGDKVFTTTAVGAAADVCNLSETTSGRFYTANQAPDGAGKTTLTSSTLVGHGTSAPVVHDEHVFILPATGQPLLVGEKNKWNNGAANSGETRSRVLIYDPIPDGRLPR